MEWVGISLAVIALGGAATMAVLLVRSRRRLAEAHAALARDTEAERALAAAEERARIAREMHDVVAHTLSVMVAQADGGRFAASADPPAAVRALETIGDVGRSALAEMRAMLGLLRGAEDDATLRPQPSLADIPALVAATRERGLDVSSVTTGTPRQLPIGAGLAVYRVVQESLTNVLKHAGPSPRVYVQTSWEADALMVAVSDDGRGAAARTGHGLGILGMRERVAVFGGTLTAGPRAGGGFLVRARLPLTAAAPPPGHESPGILAS